MGVIFSVGIPLANSGLGIFGFLGRFVVNGARTLPPGPDPIQQEIDWYHAPLDQKYAPRQGAWALGLVVGRSDAALRRPLVGSGAVMGAFGAFPLGIARAAASRRRREA